MLIKYWIDLFFDDYYLISWIFLIRIDVSQIQFRQSLKKYQKISLDPFVAIFG